MLRHQSLFPGLGEGSDAITQLRRSLRELGLRYQACNLGTEVQRTKHGLRREAKPMMLDVKTKAGRVP